MKQLKTLITIFLLAGMCHAQNVLVYYDLDTLGSRPGEILVSDQYQAVIEFPEGNLGTPRTARADWLTIETDPSGKIFIRANRANVRTDLLVPVNGRTVIFSIVSDPQATSGRRYVIRQPRPLPRVTSNNTDPGGTLVTSIAQDDLPDDIKFEITSATFRRGKELAITYALENRSGNPVAADRGRLQIVYGDSTIERSISTNSRGRLLSGEVEYGTVVIPNAPEETVLLSWRLVEIGPGETYTVQRTIGEGLATLP